MATINIVVTVANPGSGNRYYLDGVLQATISAIPGNTYKFDQADGTNSGHPLRLSITSNGTHSGGSAYTDGVTTSGTPGSGGAYTQIVVDATTVQTLYYYCTNHSNMGGSFNVGSSSTIQLQDRDGFPVQNFSADQTSVGQIYYNSASGTFKGVLAGGVSIGTWSSSGALNTARTAGLLAGSLTAGLYAGGNTPPSSQVSEEYNGTSWTNGNSMVEAARNDQYGFGTQTAALSAGGVVGATGNKSKLVELYNGTSWTAGTDINQTRAAGGSAGKAQTAGIIFGGKDSTGPGNTDNADTEYWNGSTWAQEADLNTAGAYVAGGGTYTSALCGVGGNRPAQNESWDGTSWSEISEQNTYRDQSGGSADSNVSGLIYAGEAPPVTTITEAWNGTTWTEVADMGTARSLGSGATGGQSGGASSALGVGGQIAPGARTGLTEEWVAADIQVKTLTTS